jgi:predicted metalloprotease with PDZ domain
MRIVGSMLIALLLESSLIGCELWSHHQPVSLSANISLGKASNADDRAPLDPKGGYAGMQLDHNRIVCVFAGSPAGKAGIKAGDKILDIDGKSTFGLEGAGVADKIKGTVGSEVDLIVEHGDIMSKYCLLRAEPTAEELAVIQSGESGCALVDCFNQGSSRF